MHNRAIIFDSSNATPAGSFFMLQEKNTITDLFLYHPTIKTFMHRYFVAGSVGVIINSFFSVLQQSIHMSHENQTCTLCFCSLTPKKLRQVFFYVDYQADDENLQFNEV